MKLLTRLMTGGIVLVLLATAVLVLYAQSLDAQLQAEQFLPTSTNPHLNPAERLYLQNYLSNHIEQLAQPAGANTEAVRFEVTFGQTADTIASNLINLGLLNDKELFLNYGRYYGLDSQLEAGQFLVPVGATLPELTAILTQARDLDVTLNFLEGWRVEEMADYLRVTRPAQIDAAVFLQLVRRQVPFDVTSYPFLTSLPAEASLEGFLFPDTYTIPVEATAETLLRVMLENFDTQVTPEMRQGFGVQGLTLHEAVIVASIVEREAVVEAERPLIASVFLNRINIGMRLQADPTTQYAVGYQSANNSWWKSPLSLNDLQVESPYNTYVVDGLPPTPISNPSLGSLQAVANPAVTDWFFFVASCTPAEAGQHRFSTTYEEHLSNVANCGA